MKIIITCIVLLFSIGCFSQNNTKIIAKGNKAFAAKNYIAAETDYRISSSNAPATAPAAYNLGNSIYRQNLPGEAKFAYMKAAENAKTKKQRHLAYHNLGNSLMHEKNYQMAVEAYKNALRNNPADEQTRYNFALAKKMLKDNPPPPPPKDDKKDDKNKKDQDKNQGGQGDNKDKGDKGDNKDKGDKGKDEQKDNAGDGKDKQDKGEGDKDKQPAGPSPSKQRMENLLDAMNNEEKKIQDKINAQKAKAQPKRQEKDW